MKTTLSNSESRLFGGYWQDGRLDLSAGLALVTTGIFWLTGPAVGQALAPLVAFVLYPILKRKVTEPRLGYVRFNAERRFRLRLGHWLMLGLGVITLCLGVWFYFSRGGGAENSSIAKTLMPGLPAALVGVMSIGGAAMLGLKRLLTYGAILVGSGAVVIAMNSHPGWALLAGGIAVTLWGSSMLFRFMREYPVVSPEME